MSTSPDTNDAGIESLIGRIADEFTERCQRGEEPSIEEYVQRHPEIAEVLREVLPAVQALKPPRMDPETADEVAGAAVDSKDTTNYVPGEDSARGASGLRSRVASRHDGQAAAKAPSIRVDGYEILDELGRGGMGIVYKARHLALNRLVALKMIRGGELADDKDLERFRSEALAVAQVKHPNIIEIYEVGKHDGLPYFSLEYIEGGNLAQRLNGEPQPPRSAAETIKTLADAIQAAHDNGLVHRDLKPANVLLSVVRGQSSVAGTDAQPRTTDQERRTIPKITDFGLVKHLQSRDRKGAELTQTGAIVGTPSYMSPEQAGGQSKSISAAVDIYALGAILYDTITGRPPFKGASVLETIQQVQNQDPVPPRQLQPNCPKDLETICLKCLQKSPAQRYSTAADLAGDLQAFLDGRPIQARPIGIWERTAKWVRRRPAFAGILVLSFVTMLALIGVTLGAINADYQARAKTQAEQNAKEQTRLKSLAEVHRYATTIFLAYNEWKDNNVARAKQLLAECPERLRHWEWGYVNRLCTAELLTYRGHKLPSVSNVCFSADGKYVASTTSANYGKSQGGVRVWHADTGAEAFQLAETVGPVRDVLFSPAGQYLVTVSDVPGKRGKREGSQLTIWDFARRKMVFREKTDTSAFHGLAFHPDGKSLAGVHATKTLKIWQVPTGKEILSKSDFKHKLFRLVYSPDGKRLAASTGNEFKVLDAATGKELASMRGHDRGLVGLAFIRDGERLVSAAGSNETLGEPSDLEMWSAKTGGRYRSHWFYGHDKGVTRLLSNAKGDWLAAGHTDGRITLWHVLHHDRKIVLRGHADDVRDLAFRPDGRRLASASGDGTVKIWDTQTNPEYYKYTPRGENNHPAIVRDLPRIVTRSAGNSYDIQLGNEKLTSVRFSDKRIRSPNFSPKGKYLLGKATLVDRAKKTNETIFELADANTGKILHTWKLPYYGLTATFSADEKLLAVGTTDKKVVVWSVLDGKKQHEFDGHIGWVEQVGFSPDGDYLFSCSTEIDHIEVLGELKVWDLRTGSLVRTFTHPKCRFRAAFHPDGKRLVASATTRVDSPGPLFVWQWADGKLLHELKGHARDVYWLVFSPDGKRLVTGGDDVVRFWDLASGVQVFTYRYGIQAVLPEAFSDDGRRLRLSVNSRRLFFLDSEPLVAHSPRGEN